MNYITTIGLEIHAELKTETKMFCNTANNPFDVKPNTNVCPVCMAYPGTLPTINKKAVESMIRVGLAVGGEIANFTEFDRKNYFYPDIPKAYQISQLKYPIVSGGNLADIEVTRVHLEEDTATSKHEEGYSLVDYNRAGVPLMELVTEPVIHTPEEAGRFGRELQLLLRTLGVSDANMEKGEMRVELNISIAPEGASELGTKVEVKNIASFNMMERGAYFEIERMKKLWEEGKQDEIIQETRGWNDIKQETFSQRVKENSADYRYFPDPDLPKLYLHELFDIESMRADLPELPAQKRSRYSEFDLKEEDVELYVYDRELGLYFDNIISELKGDKNKLKIASNFIANELQGSELSVEEYISPFMMSEIIDMLNGGELNSNAATILATTPASAFASGISVRDYATEKNLLQLNDESALEDIVVSVISSHSGPVEEYRAGKETILKFLVGMCMKESKGSGNPQKFEELLKKNI
ncbi:MAG: aspartyl-tRNA(Asn)/glutamyl-tRNA(Gln) amidotransferase subunit B [Flavobacteriaceae bacterium]|jgi:aspartyl-tRNA(Asn)/glutamyl-tRNA(Gln) amidotransferase subunit B